ncbi:pre-peptidase C-terminal domain-containing protein [Myxococcota bacterium]|nr:pre-peptidase C-terminal domain-containing protein [Myxococcota bacterium]
MFRSSRLFVMLGLGAALGCGGSGSDDPLPKGTRIMSFKASAPVIAIGQEVTLTWETVNAPGVAIEPRVGLQPANGSATDRPIATTTYILTIPGGPRDLTAAVTVEVTGGPPVVQSFTATPRTIMEGEAALLEWTTANADSVTIEPGLGTQPADGSIEVRPRVTTTYRLTAIKGNEAAPPQEVVVVVASGNQPIVRRFDATPQTAAPGEAVTLAWTADNATGVTIDNGVGPQPAMGTATVRPSQTTIYTLTATGPGGSAVASVTVTVIPAGDPEITRFVALPMTIAPGGSADLDWDTNDATGVTIDNGVGAQPAKGTVTVSPARTTTYTLTALGNNTAVTAQVTITVAAANAAVVTSFAAQPSAVVAGGSTTLTWTTQSATSVSIDNGVGASLAANGSISVSPSQTTTYTLTARGAGGDATAQTTVTVNAAPPSVSAFTASPASITAGQSATLAWTTQSATSVSIDNGLGTQPANGSVTVSPSQSTVYTLTATGPGGTTTAQVTLTVTTVGAPSVASFTATPQQVSPGGAATLAWSVSNATSVEIDNGVGAQPLAGSVGVTPGATTTYTLSATGPGGTTTAQVTVSVVSTTGDQCSDAFIVTGSGTFTGDTQQAVNDYSATRSCAGFDATGPDVVYRVTLQTGDRLQASLAPSGTSWDTSIYLLTSCADVATSCVAGQDNGNPEELDYTAASAGDYYLVVDGYGSAAGAYTLSITINAAPIPNDVCAGAIDVTAGGSFSGDTRSATANYSPGSGGCTRFAENSRDVAYRATLAAGERLQATLTASWDAALYVVTDCGDPVNTCVAGQDDGNPEVVDFTSATGGSYFIIVDGYGSAAGTYGLDVTISPPVTGGDTCTSAVVIPAGGGSFQSTTIGLANDYDPPTTCTGYSAAGADQAYVVDLDAGDVVEATAEFGGALDGSLYVVTSCGSLSSCVAGADEGGTAESLRFVAETSGPHYVIVDSFGAGTSGTHDLTVASWTAETCADAPPLDVSGTPEWYTTSGKVNDYSPNSGGCTGYTAGGPDRAYAITVAAGDQLVLDLAPSGYDASIYVVSSCADVTGSCIAGADRGLSGGAESLAPVFQQAGTYHVIVDGFLSAQGSGTLTARRARGDTCADPYVVPASGGTFAGTTAGYGADVGAASSSGSCTGYSQTGRDAIYRVTIPAGDTLTASLTSTWDAALYLVSSCASAATTCVAGQDDGSPEDVTWTNTTGAAVTYDLVVDAWQPSTTTVTREGNYTLTVTVN